MTKETTQTKKPNQSAKSKEVESEIKGSKLSFKTLPIKAIDQLSPNAVESSLSENHLIIITLFPMSNDSPPNPKIPLPNKVIGKDPMLTPNVKTACTIVTSSEVKKIKDLIPNLSIKKPATMGTTMLGKKKTEYNMLN